VLLILDQTFARTIKAEEVNVMKPTEILELEHRTIAKVAEACGVLAGELQNGKRVPAGVLQGVVEFLRVYGNQYHDGEEQWLISMLRMKGMSAASFPIAWLKKQDDKLGGAVDQLATAVDVYVKTGGVVTSTLVDALARLAQLYPDHISTENEFLLPLANELLSEVEQQVLGEMFHLVDVAKGKQARHTIEQLSTAIKMCPECNAGSAQTCAA
jgi:hemerythrin-like domain-containing protein